MANITIEGAIYTNLHNVPDTVTGIGRKPIGNSANLVVDLESGDTPTKLVNAVEIDWNGASICNQTVNTTAQLLSN